MRWGWRVAIATALAAVVVSRGIGALPPQVPLAELSAHVGDVVTVEGDVAAAYTSGGTCVLEFDAADPKGFRAVLVIPMFTDLPRQPERLYAGRRVRVSGRVQRFQGRLEMVLKSPSQVEIVDVAGVPPPPGPIATGPEPPPAAPAAPAVVPEAPTVAPAAPAAAPEAPSPAPAPAAPAAEPPGVAAPAAEPPRVAAPAPEPAAPLAAVPPAATDRPAPPPPPAERPAPPPARSLVEAVERRLPGPDPCKQARAAWRAAAARVTAATDALSRCLAAETYRCRPEAMAVTPALAQLEAAEQHVEDDCR